MPESAAKNLNLPLVLLAVSVAILAGMAGLFLWLMLQRPVPMEVLTLLPEPKPISDFSLNDQESRAFSQANLRGGWSLLFFGFTHCPDVCPNALFTLQQVDELLGEAGDEAGPAVQVIFVSVDPARDTPEKLRDYVHYFDPGFVGVTGDEAQLVSLTSQLGIAFQIEEHPSEQADYEVLHSSAIILMNPQGEMHGAFTAPHYAEKMARDLAAIID